MSIQYMHGAHGSFPELHVHAAAGALAAGVGVALNAGELVIATGATNVALIGITEEAATVAHQKIKVCPLQADALLKLTKTGTATPVVGGKYDLAADGQSINADSSANFKVKVLQALDPLPGATVVTEWLCMNISAHL